MSYYSPKFASKVQDINDVRTMSGTRKLKMKNSLTRFCNKTGGNFYKRDLILPKPQILKNMITIMSNDKEPKQEISFCKTKGPTSFKSVLKTFINS